MVLAGATTPMGEATGSAEEADEEQQQMQRMQLACMFQMQFAAMAQMQMFQQQMVANAAGGGMMPMCGADGAVAGGMMPVCGADGSVAGGMMPMCGADGSVAGGMMPMVPMMAFQMPFQMPAEMACPGGAAAPAAQEHSWDEPLACTPEEFAAMEEEAKQAEQAAKIAARESGSFVGLMARYIEDAGFGFISCPECKEFWDKTDIFVSGRSFMQSGIDVGDMVTFRVEKDGKELPRAVNPKTLDDLTAMRKRLGRMREAMKITSAKRALGAPGDAAGAPPPLMPRVKRVNMGPGPP